MVSPNSQAERITEAHTLSVFAGNLGNDIVLHETGGILVHAQLDPSLGPEARVCSHGDSEGLGQFKVWLLGEVRVELNLSDLRLVAGVAEDVDEQGTSDVAEMWC